MYGSDLDLAERRKLNWRAIAAGTTAALGIQVLMLYLGSALGISRFQVHAGPAREWAVLVPAVYLLFATLLAAFGGAWITGHWANLYASEDAFLHGGMTWALYALIITAGLGSVLESGSRIFKSPAKDPAPPQESDATYSLWKDQSFLEFAAGRAREYANRGERDPLQASDTEAAATPRLNSADFQRFLREESGLSDDDARGFLAAESASLSQELRRSERAWHRAHQQQAMLQEPERKSALIVGWSLVVIALTSLGAAITGAYLGWRQRYVNFADPDLMVEDELRPQYPKAL